MHSDKTDIKLMYYQPPTLYAPSRGTWRISWYNIHPGTTELTRIQKTFDLNRIRDVQLRREYALSIMHELWAALRKGYNFFIHSQGMPEHEDLPQQLSIHALMQTILQVRTAGKKQRTVQSYNSLCHVFCEWLKSSKMAGKPAEQFSAQEFQKFIIAKLKDGSGNRNVNDYITFVKGCMKEAVNLNYIIVNQIAKVKPLPAQDSSLFEIITPAELLRIGPALKAYSLPYYLYTKFTAMQFIRPYHIAFIKAADIDYTNNLIKITAEGSKNRKIKHKQLMPDVKKLLLELNYHQLPGNMYLFGKGFEPAKLLHKSLSKRSAELWRKLVIDGLGINKKMYALKHTAGQYYVNENAQLDAGWLQHHMEHSSLTETEAYIHNRKTKQLNMQDVKLIKY